MSISTNCKAFQKIFLSPDPSDTRNLWFMPWKGLVHVPSPLEEFGSCPACEISESIISIIKLIIWLFDYLHNQFDYSIINIITGIISCYPRFSGEKQNSWRIRCEIMEFLKNFINTKKLPKKRTKLFENSEIKILSKFWQNSVKKCKLIIFNSQNCFKISWKFFQNYCKMMWKIQHKKTRDEWNMNDDKPYFAQKSCLKQTSRDWLQK